MNDYRYFNSRSTMASENKFFETIKMRFLFKELDYCKFENFEALNNQPDKTKQFRL